MRFRSVASLLAFCCLFANGCSKGISRATAATVFSVKGNVVFGNSERNHFQPVTLKSRIHSGNTVRSADGASINLALIPGALAQLSGNSEIKIEELRITKDGNQTAGGMRDRRTRARPSIGLAKSPPALTSTAKTISIVLLFAERMLLKESAVRQCRRDDNSL